MGSNKNITRWGRLQSTSGSKAQVEDHSGEVRSDVDRPQEHGYASRAPVGSKTITIQQDADNGVIIMCAGTAPVTLDEGDSVMYSAGGATVHCEGGKVNINGDAFGGLIDITTFTGLLNTMITAFNTHTHVGRPTSEIPLPAYIQPPLVKADYENTDVNHG